MERGEYADLSGIFSNPYQKTLISKISKKPNIPKFPKTKFHTNKTLKHDPDQASMDSSAYWISQS